jgi:signal transduction histidine kinase
MRLRGQLSIWTCVLVTSVILVMGTGVYFGERVHLLHTKDEARRMALAQFARIAIDATAVRDDIALLNAADTVARSPGAVASFVEDGNGVLLAHSDVSRVGLREDGQPSPGSFELSYPLPRGGRAVIRFSQALIDADVGRSLRHTLRLLAAVSGVVFGLGWLGAAWLARGLTRPLERLAEGAQAVARGRWDHRLNSDRRDELGALARTFDAMAARLGELDRMKNDFVANVTHELRSPLSAIESSVNVILEGLRTGDASESADYLTVVRNNAARLGRFINDLLDVARIEAKRVDLSPAPVAVGDLLSEVAQLHQSKAREKGIGLRADAPPPGLVVTADPDKLHLILCNLVGNALKFTPAGGRIVMAAERRGKGVRFRVSDTGVGIAPEDADRIFNRFEQAAAPAKGPKGTGLGLAICRGWVEAHGGAIRVESVLGQGSVFIVDLPTGGSA